MPAYGQLLDRADSKRVLIYLRRLDPETGENLRKKEANPVSKSTREEDSTDGSSQVPKDSESKSSIIKGPETTKRSVQTPTTIQKGAQGQSKTASEAQPSTQGNKSE